jgi:GT2 family glycosyltransferase
MSISIVTPWHNHPELIADYVLAVQGAQVVIVDNGSHRETRLATTDMVLGLGNGSYHRHNFENQWFAAACNQGLEKATGDIIVMLNNDIIAEPGWLAAVERDVKGDGLYGPETHVKIIQGRPLLYVDGWCVAARREVWQRLGGFDAVTFAKPYWEDVDLSWRAVQKGYTLHQRRWKVRHLGNTTSRTVAGAYDASEANRAAFEAKVAAHG